MKPEVKVFTRDNPCNKLDLWNCFKGRRGWKLIQVDTAHSLVGLNAPKYMVRMEYIEHIRGKQKDVYKMTEAGSVWLTEKFKAYLVNHPEHRKLAHYLPKGF